MTLEGQRVQPDRYAVIPRTLSFLTRPDEILLQKIAPGRSAWSGLLNGVGGHIEQGESPTDAAMREILEETGLHASDLKLCGVMLIDTGSSPGIGLYVFVGQANTDEPLKSSSEGSPEWVARSSINTLQLVQDLYHVIPRALTCYENGTTFTSLTTFDSKGSPILSFSP